MSGHALEDRASATRGGSAGRPRWRGSRARAAAARACRGHSRPRPVRRVGQAVARVQPLHEQAAETRAAPHHEVADVGVVDLAHRLGGRPRLAQLGRRRAGIQPVITATACRHRRVSASPSALAQREHEAARQHPDQRDERVRLEEHAHPAARRGARLGRGAPAREPLVERRGLAVANAARGRDEHARAGEARPPTQVDVVGAGLRRRRRSRRTRGTGRRARASSRARRRTRRAHRRVVPDRSHPVRSPRTALP